MSNAIYYLDSANSALGDSVPVSVPVHAIDIPLNDVLDKSALLTSLAKACDFPSYFSHNWDSAWDCLTDSEITQLKLDLTKVKNINTEDFMIFKSIIEDAYRDFGKPQLWIVVSSKDE